MAALLAVMIGAAVGVMTAGIVPGCQKWHVGVCSLQAWLTAFTVYIVLRMLELKGAAIFGKGWSDIGAVVSTESPD